MKDKKEFLKQYFPSTVNDIQLVCMDLDITGLSIADILRNVNTSFPQNSVERIKIINHEKVVAILCLAECLSPIKGIFVIICGPDMKIRIESKSYIVIGVNEKNISDEDSINDIIEGLIKYFSAEEVRREFGDFEEFFRKYLYNDYEEEISDD